jgi:DNA-binding transcriptional LysR family regulator
LSQPAFSRSVQAIETELGLPLFDRGSTEATPTTAGAFVIERARRLLFDSRCLERDVGLFRQQQLGDLTFGAGPFPAATLLPALMTDLRRRHPAIKVRIEVNNWDYLAQHLRNEELDFFVADTRELPHGPDLDVLPLARQHGGFYARTGHPLLGQRRVRPAAMVPFGLASVRLPRVIHAAVLEMLGLGPDQPLPLALESDDLHLLKHVAINSDTVLAASHAVVQHEVASGQLALVDISPLPALYAEMGIVSLKGRSHAPMAQFVVNRLVTLASKSAHR